MPESGNIVSRLDPSGGFEMKFVKASLGALAFLVLGSNLFAATVTVDASAITVTIPQEIYGSNMSTYTGVTTGEAAYATAMQVSGSRNIRWPGGSYSDIVNWNDTGSAPGCLGYGASTPQFISLLGMFGGHLQAEVNYAGYWCGTQYTLAQAVALAVQWVTTNM